MTDDELKSPERLAEDKAMAKENMNNAMVPQEEKSISSSLTCGKCGQKKVSYSQAQTRSADEPMTVSGLWHLLSGANERRHSASARCAEIAGSSRDWFQPV